MADIISKHESIYEPIKKMRKKAKGKNTSKEDEFKLNQQKQIREERERRQREMILSGITILFKKVKAKGIRRIHKVEEIKEWKRYTNCDQLPYPEVPTSVRKHFLVWRQEKKFADIEEVDKSLKIYVPIFNIIKHIIDIPLKLYSNIIKSLQEVIVDWKREFIEKIDYACFLLIKDIRKYFTHLDFYTKEYNQTFEYFKLGMWSLLDVPMQSDFERESSVIEFPSMGVTVSLPFPYNKKPFVIRVIYTTLDFFSDVTKTNQKPDYIKAPDLLSEIKRYEELKEAVQSELREQERLKLELEKEKIEKMDANEIHSRYEMQDDELEGKLPRRSTSSSMLSTVSRWPQRANSNNSQFSITSTSTKSRIWGSTKTDSKIFFPFNEIKKGPLWESDSENVRHSGSFSTFSMKPRTSNAYSTDYGAEKVNLLHNSLKWSCPDIDLLFSKDSEMDVTKSFSFLDLLFHFYDNERVSQFSSEKTLQELVKQSNLKFKKIIIDIFQEIKPLHEIVSKREEERYEEFVENMTIETEPYEINLRKYHTFSGIYWVDLIKHTSDLCKIRVGNFLQMQEGPYQLEKDNFFIQTKKQTFDSLTSNFEIKSEDYYFDMIEAMEVHETEQPLENQPKIDEPIKLKLRKSSCEEKLIIIKICLPRNVFWFMKPQPAVWDKDKNIWSVEHVYEVEHNRRDFIMQFKLGKIGPITMFTLRFHELPYKSWTLSPLEEEGRVILTLQGQHLTVEFQVMEDKICLNSIMECPQHLLEGIVGKFVSINELMDKMKSIGLDVFPEHDTFVYIDGCSAKPLALEDHIYFTMAMFSNILQFTSSSWNLAIGHNDIAFKCRLYAPFASLSFKTYKTNNFRCEMVLVQDDTDVLPEYTYKDKNFYPDAYSLLTKLYAKNIHFLHSDSVKVFTVYNLLKKTKVLTFSGDPNKCL